MPDLRLETKPFLGDFSVTRGDTEIAEVTTKSLVSIAIPLDGEDQLSAAVSNAYGLPLPAVGKTTGATDSQMCLIGLQRDQCFALFDRTDDRPVNMIAEKLGSSAAYYTDQSDSWVMLRLKGPLALDSLERICQLDLHDSTFPIGAAARTAMEHLGTIIIRENADSYLLMSAGSSAQSFLHAVETSLKNVA